MKCIKLILITLVGFALLFLNPIYAHATPNDVLFFDDFGNGDLSNWTIQSGSWSINNNNLLTTKGGITNFLAKIRTGDINWDNYRVEFDVNNVSTVDEYIAFRYIPENAYVFNFRHGTGESDTPEIKFFKLINGNYNQITSSHAQELLNNNWYHIKVEVVNENIKLWVNDNQIFDLTDSSFKKGGIGLQAWTGELGATNVRFDNVKVTSLSPIVSKTPLIIIPGIAGSELKVNEDTIWSKPDGHGGVFNKAYAKDEKVWVNEPEIIKPGNDDYFDVLRMKGDGVTSEANVELTGNLYGGVYQAVIDFFTSNGYTLNQDLFIFPYDWRKDINETKNLLDQKISQVKTQTGSQKVDIIAHSLGGLVARNYISDPNLAVNVGKLFTLGAPNLGSVDFLKNLKYGGCLRFQIGAFCLSIAPSEVKDILQNMISGFQLAPSQAYFNFYTGADKKHPYPYRTNTGTLNYQQIKNLLAALGYNTQLFTPSEIFHSIDSSLYKTNDVDVTVVAGSGQPTLGQIIEKKVIPLFGNDSINKDILITNGDETVPLFSASLYDESNNLSYLGPAKLFYTNQKHGDLVSNGPALNLVKNVLAGNPDLPLDVSENPFHLPLFSLLSVYSPVNIHIYDSGGNHTGPTADGDFEENIPGSFYETLGDAKFIYLTPGEIYHVKFESTGNGSFDFKIRRYENEQITKTIFYNDIGQTTQTKAETIFDPSSDIPPVIGLDEDGNGTTDNQVNPSSVLTGDSVYDLTPPKTEVILSGTKGKKGWYKSGVTITLNAQDEENGSGILQTEYTLDGKTIQTYNGPFTIAGEGVSKLKVRSLDNAGNEEDAKEVEIKIDKTAPEAKIYVDLDKMDIRVKGIDTNKTTVVSGPNTQTRKRDDAIYTITDAAGNTTVLDVREVDRQQRDKFSVYSIKYNNQAPVKLADNYFNVSYRGRKIKANVYEQYFKLRGEVKIRIEYDQRKNQSTIYVREGKREKIKEVVKGVTILKLQTTLGQLQTTY